MPTTPRTWLRVAFGYDDIQPSVRRWPGGNLPAPFGQMVTAMITPMTPDGAVDYDGAARLADYLVTDMRNDGLVVNGTTGEAPTTTDAEKERLLARAVLEAVGNRAKVVAGVGTNITAHTIELARRPNGPGRTACWWLPRTTTSRRSPPWRRTSPRSPTATGLPMLIYDIPARTGAAVATDTLIRLAAHPRIVGVKDAKDDPRATSHVLARTDLVYYCGTDLLNLPLALPRRGRLRQRGRPRGRGPAARDDRRVRRGQTRPRPRRSTTSCSRSTTGCSATRARS